MFDVGETLIDETGPWERVADAAGVPRFTLMGVLGGLAACGEHHPRVWSMLRVGASGLWDVEKLSPESFERLVAEAGVEAGGVAYVGERVENDVEPALPDALDV